MTWRIKKVFAIVAGFAMGAFSLTMGIKEFIHSKQLAAHGKIAQGQVTELESRPIYRSHSRIYYLRVKFEADQPREQRISVSQAIYDAASEGDVVTVHYLPEDPSYCQIGETVEVRYKNIGWGLVFIFGAT